LFVLFFLFSRRLSLSFTKFIYNNTYKMAVVVEGGVETDCIEQRGRRERRQKMAEGIQKV